jgi:hypothetical protein
MDAAEPVFAGEVADCNASAWVERGTGSDDSKMAAGIVCDNEKSCLLPDDVGDGISAGVCRCTSVAGGRDHTPVVISTSEAKDETNDDNR